MLTDESAREEFGRVIKADVCLDDLFVSGRQITVSCWYRMHQKSLF